MLYNFYNHLPWSLPCVYERDYAIYLEGDLCDKVGIILKGSVELIHYTVDGQRNVLSTLKKGDAFGDVLIFSSHPYYIGALIAKEKTMIAYIDKEKLQQALDDKDFQTQFLNTLSNKAFIFNKQVKLLKQTSIKEKVLFFMEMKTQETNSDKIHIPSLTDLAAYLNVQRPSLSRVLKTLLDKNIIQRDNKWYWLNERRYHD